ncbi:hypothetical protein DER46DRAFT_595452 [Fusarium sp. MPI-SDFR-AT-0072]|nr:hypothetical protein DER46DRAFT_595452 [Fusarium sp. MPI-SDFR-AT-0072]
MNALSSLQAVLCCIVLCYAARRTVRYLVMSYCVGFLSGFSNGSFNIIFVVISIQYYSIVVGLILMPHWCQKCPNPSRQLLWRRVPLDTQQSVAPSN